MKLSILGCAWTLAVCVAPSWSMPQPAKLWNKDYRHKKFPSKVGKRSTPSTACVESSAFSVSSAKDNVFWGLADYEVASVAEWLFAQPDLSLVVSENATETDDTIAIIQLLQPNKTDALAYLDGDGPAPPRYAHAILSISSVDEPYYADIMVGPLPIDNSTTSWVPLEYPYTKQAKGQVRNLDADWETLYTEWVYVITASVADITEDLIGGSVNGTENDTLSVWGVDPYWQDDGRVVRWDSFFGYPTSDFDTMTLLPLGLYFKSDVTGRDPSQWVFQGWLYNNIFYETTEAFRAAWESPDFVKIPINTDGPEGSTDQQGPVLPMDTYAPPTSIAPSGSRFTVDNDKKFIQWMDFEFYLSFNRDTGVHLYDIKYKGQRIIYELGLQEALAHYASNDPFQSGTAYLDSYYGFGPYMYELVDGYDCPSHSTYLNTSFYTGETTRTHINSICLFEYDPGFPLQRHTTGDYVSVTKNIFFTVRAIATIGNYDYLFSYEFYMDGTIGVDLRASGYIQSTNAANNADYGYTINGESLSGSMHDHVLNFKLDLDILGTANTLELTKIVPTTEEYAWSPTPRNTMKLERSFLETEDDGKIFWDFNAGTMYTVINKDQPNAFGEYPGYRISPSAGTAHLTILNSTNLANAANWATHDLFVTAHHDTEPRSAHPYNSQDVHDPPVDFNDFFDGESLEQTDLVLWFNLGMHHVPHTGDLPNTVFTTSHSAVRISPHNYLTMDASRATVQMVRVNYGAGEAAEVTTFDKEDSVCAVGLESQDGLLEGYLGDVVIRKFPYDPSDPWFETGWIGK